MPLDVRENHIVSHNNNISFNLFAPVLQHHLLYSSSATTAKTNKKSLIVISTCLKGRHIAKKETYVRDSSVILCII